MTRRHTNTVIGTTHTVCSKDGTTISYLSIGSGPSVLVIPGVLSVAADYAAFARSLAEHFTVHTIERRGRGESGPQGMITASSKSVRMRSPCEPRLARLCSLATATADWWPWKWLATPQPSPK